MSDVADVPVRRVALTLSHSLGVVGGGTVHVLEVAAALHRRGLDVELFAIGEAAPAFPVPPVRITTVRPSRVHYYLEALSLAAAVRRSHRERPFDAVCFFWWEGAVLRFAVRGATILAFGASPYSAWRNRPGGSRGVRRLGDILLRDVPTRRADVVLANSTSARDELLDVVGVAPERVVVAPLGVDPAFGCVGEQRRPSHPDGRTRALFFGSFESIKGVDDAVAAAVAAAPRMAGGLSLRLVGAPDDAARRALLRQVRPPLDLEIVGPADRDVLLRHLAWADVALLPSRSESFGLAMAEAQAAGLAVVAWRVGSVPEVVADGVTGWLAPPGDLRALAEALVAAGDHDERRRRGEAGRRRALERFSWDRYADVMVGELGRAASSR